MPEQSKPIKVAILGTRGIPNRHGGFEQMTEYVAPGLVKLGFEVTVYQSSLHDYKASEFQGVKLVHCTDPEDKLGTFGQFIYDWNCLRDARKRQFDVLIQLGYTSSSIWGWYHPRQIPVLWNMDGLEWKRDKYSRPVKKLLHWAEGWAARRADHLIADSPAIADHLLKNYGRTSTFIAYGAEPDEREDASFLQPYGVLPGEYYMLMARMEPENSIETIIRGYLASGEHRPLLVVGKLSTPHAKVWQARYRDSKVHFLGGIYDQTVVHQLRRQARAYFHGHTVGGTNPSLLEAMASGAWIIAHRNPFNQAILKENAHYFSSESDIAEVINRLNPDLRPSMTSANLKSIQQQFLHEHIIQAYAELIRQWAR